MGILDRFRMARIPGRGRGGRRVLVLGIDGAPYGLIERLSESGDMPQMARLRRTGRLLRMRSSMPPISSVAWTGFLTGVNPAKHGIFGFTERKVGTYETYFPNAQHIRSATIGEILERHGKRTIVLNVPNTYPARPMASILISGFVAIDLKRAVHPPALLPRLESMGYRIDVDYRTAAEKPEAFFADLFHTLERRRQAFLHFLTQERWDLFVGVFTESDRLHHYFWDAYEDPGACHHEAFLRFYRRLDAILGEIIGHIGDEVDLLLLSDHGFCALQSEVYVNNWLREQGYLRLRKEPTESLADIDPTSRAFCLDPGRIYLNLKGRMPQGCVDPGLDAEALCREMAEGLLGLTDGGGEKVIDQVFQKAELYHGPFEAMAPDLVLHSRRGFDLKGATGKPGLFGKGKLNGMHTYDDAFLYVRGATDARPDVEILDVLPTILHRLGVAQPDDLDGAPVDSSRAERTGRP